MSGKDGTKVREYMDKLNAEGIYKVDDEILLKLKTNLQLVI